MSKIGDFDSYKLYLIIDKLERIKGQLEKEAKYLDCLDEAVSHITSAIDVLKWGQK